MAFPAGRRQAPSALSAIAWPAPASLPAGALAAAAFATGLAAAGFAAAAVFPAAGFGRRFCRVAVTGIVAAFGLAAALATGAFGLAAPAAAFGAALAGPAFTGAVVFDAFATRSSLDNSSFVRAVLAPELTETSSAAAWISSMYGLYRRPCKSCPCGKAVKDLPPKIFAAADTASRCPAASSAGAKAGAIIVIARSAINEKMRSLTIP